MNVTTLIFITKLRKLQHQINAARLADYAYSDEEDALDILLTRTNEVLERVRDSETLSVGVRNSVLRETSFFIMRVTEIVGIIVRSTSVRNAFELYAPFLDLSRALVGEDARLILSSEWQYVPFTHPQTLQDLPQFIIIGLPASESDNTLIFPTAGHELGHSIWTRHNLHQQFQPKIRTTTDTLFLKHKDQLSQTFADLKGVDFDQNIFAQIIKSSIIKSAMDQLEEFFADFIGLILFGESYLFAFEYLVAPQLSSSRDLAYPDTVFRTQTLQRIAEKELGVVVKEYSSSFLPQQPVQIAPQKMIMLLADEAVTLHVDELFAGARKLVDDAKVTIPTNRRTSEVEKAFRNGVPFDGEATLGDLINAAWRIFKSETNGTYIRQGREVVDYLTDLVLKSVEIHEIKAYTQ